MSSGDLEGANSPSLSNGDKSNGGTFSDCDQTDENLISSPTVSDSIKSDRKTFGWFGYQPKCLQHLLSAKWALFWMCWAGALQGLLVNGCINVVITTIEKRYGLRSSQTGLVASGYDIASFVCLVPVTYFGGRKNASKPKWIGLGMIMMGLGSMVFSLPHFLVGSYRATSVETNVCLTEANVNTTCTDKLINANDDLSWNVWFFFLAQLLHGAGAAPLFTLGVTFIDENVSKKMSSVYLGIYYTMTIIGPAVGYVVGGQLLQIYTDFLTVDPLTFGLTPNSKVWIGAWWIGFVFIALICLLLSIPILAYPSSLPGSEKLQQVKVSEAHNGSTPKQYSKLREMHKAIFALLQNPTLFFLNLAGASEGLIIAGFAAFLPKQIENQFSVTAISAALVMGLITVPAGGGGTFFGGYLVKKFNLACSGIIKMCLISTAIATCFTVCFFISCPNMHFAGITGPYRTQVETYETNTIRPPQHFAKQFHLESECNSMCKCSRSHYDPVCGVDGIMYYSPCHAGCFKELNMDNSKVYLDCECISVPNKTQDRGYDAINTMCNTKCNNLWYFVSLCFFVMFFTFLSTMPALSGTLRCVHSEQRSFALGIQWIVVRVLGTIPAPMIFGSLIDDSCILWQESCNEAGACLVYDNSSLSRYMLYLALTAKLCSTIFFFGAWMSYIPPKHIQQNDQESNENTQDEAEHEVIIYNNNRSNPIDDNV
ncbi:solute carrier organic anion transporter family member 4A1 isoform X2 [Contarinia nasturtii]|uniref:solute carrier organic anion transporter family member 4A1 isoform X2 n=1 Tax=Contarinia nasturtii TaxID=265458 RepID=UPI0012D39E7D|nr:solute carrier organic anion transporter family member 4A1 isoform X2 [Contarinia nasturtii]